MMIQYIYALITMVPCPLWFYYRYASAAFLTVVFTWATYNGATFYIDVFGRRMEKEFEALKKEVAKWQATPEGKPILEESDPALKAVKSMSLDAQEPAQYHSENVEGIEPLKQPSTSIEEVTSTGEVRQR